MISSDEESSPATPKEPVKKRKTTEIESNKKAEKEIKKPNLSKLKKEPDAEASQLMEEDDDMEKSLMEIDESNLPTPKSNKKAPAKKGKTPKSEKKPKKEDLNESVLTDEERFERKRMNAMMYQKFKNRPTGALNPGSKEIPKGKPNCLAGCTFLITGLLDSIERDEGNQIIKDLGGKVSTVVGKKLNYLVTGEDAGLKKLATAEELGVKILTEDEFYDLIRVKSGEEPLHNNNNNHSPEAKKVKKEVESPVKKVKKEESSPKKVKKEESSSNKIKKEESSSNKIKKEEPSPKKIKKEEPSPKKVKKEEPSPKKVKKEESSSPSETKKVEDEESLAWVDKYKPTDLKQIIGQQGPASNCNKLINWLKKWYSNHDGKKKLQRPNPWAKNDDGSFYKCALLSGPPGVGKTTTATLVCKELGFDTVEFNASDTRSKKLLKEQVSELLSNKSLYGYFHGQDVVSKKHVLLMDEVDGMAGEFFVFFKLFGS